MHQNNNKFQSVIAFSILAFGIGTLVLSGSMTVRADYKTDLGRYDNTLSSTSPEAIYNYNYENTSSDTAPGYFEISLEKLAGTKAADLIDIKSITETSPIDFATKKPVEGAKTTEFKISDAVYNDGDTLKIRVSPQSECKVRPEGGCADGMVPAAVPARISIKVVLKANAPTAPSVLFGSGRIYFPSGFDANQISWKINVGDADESAIVLPTIKNETPDLAALETNKAILKSDPMNKIAASMEDRPADLKVGKPESLESPALNIQSITTDQLPPKAVKNNNVLAMVAGIAGVAILVGATLFAVNMNKKSGKTK